MSLVTMKSICGSQNVDISKLAEQITRWEMHKSINLRGEEEDKIIKTKSAGKGTQAKYIRPTHNKPKRQKNHWVIRFWQR